jgi:hypothetical protein
VLRYGFAAKIITRAVNEQWELLQKCFGDRLDVDPREFRFRQMVRPRTVTE